MNSLKNALFTTEGQKTILEWLIINWYIPVAAGVAFMIIMVSQSMADMRCLVSSAFGFGPLLHS